MRPQRDQDATDLQVETGRRRPAPMRGSLRAFPSPRRRAGRGWARSLLALAIGLGLLSGPRLAQAAHDQKEVRLYVDLDGVVYHHFSGPLFLRIRPFGRSEQRFRSDGLAYLKSFAGLRLDVLKWLGFQIYYAHKDMRYTGKPRKQAHMAVLDGLFKLKLGALRLADRNGFEYHVTDKFFRYRQMLQALVMLPWKGVRWLGFFANGELRVDSDQARVNMLDLRAGLQFRVGHHFFVKPFYYLEAKRRHADHWAKTHILGVFLAARI